MAGAQPGGGSERGDEFAAQADAPRPGLLVELWEFMATNKKWWLTPVVLVLLLVGRAHHAVEHGGRPVHLYPLLAGGPLPVVPATIGVGPDGRRLVLRPRPLTFP